MIQILAAAVFVLAYLFITIEHKIHVSKSAIAIFAGGLLWVLASLFDNEHLGEKLTHAGADVFGIVIFLLAAMSLVEVLVHYRFFDLVRGILYRWNLGEKGQFVAIAIIAFFLSGIIDNLTTTIIMIQIARKFFRGENLIRATAAIVISANAGGAFSPIGDVTTIMLWFAGKFSALEILSRGVLPSLTLFGVSLLLLLRHITKETPDTSNEIVTSLGRSEKFVISLVFVSFALPIVMSLFGLPPYFGLLIGLGVVWITIDSLKTLHPKQTHLDASIEKFIRNIDVPSLKFFVGILLAVAALDVLGLLEILAQSIYGFEPSILRLVAGNVGLGFLSSILDNVPLTAMSIQMLQTTQTSLWVLLALTVGTGGSLLVVGSAAGVVAMGMVKELNFVKYLKIAFFPALVGYIAAIGVWCIQYFALGF